MIDQVNIQSNKLELTMESMRIAREETNANVEKVSVPYSRSIYKLTNVK